MVTIDLHTDELYDLHGSRVVQYDSDKLLDFAHYMRKVDLFCNRGKGSRFDNAETAEEIQKIVDSSTVLRKMYKGYCEVQ